MKSINEELHTLLKEHSGEYYYRFCKVEVYKAVAWNCRILTSGIYSVAFFSEGTIHICDDPEELFGAPDISIFTILNHEYTHFLQWVKGKGDYVPLGINYTSEYLSEELKKQYPEKDWIIEAEANYIEDYPELLDSLEREELLKVFLTNHRQ